MERESTSVEGTTEKSERRGEERRGEERRGGTYVAYLFVTCFPSMIPQVTSPSARDMPGHLKEPTHQT